MLVDAVGSDPLVRRAKLRPPRLSNDLVHRPRLAAQLDRGLRMPLTLVAAPAGFGKTTLLAEWANGSSVPLAWLTLDTRDHDLKVFFSHFMAASEALIPEAGRPVLERFRQPQRMAPRELGAVLADALLDHTDDVVLVVDDYQVAASREVEEFLGGFLEFPPAAFHLVLATRSDPALPLTRMRLRGQVNELRAADLRFTDTEALALFTVSGRGDLDPATMTTLQHHTGGWIAGLRLAILALPAMVGLAQTEESVASVRPLMDFLVEEVLALQPEDTQEFLLRTALLDRVSVSLADALLEQWLPDGSQAILARLVDETLLLEAVADDSEWHRYHPLFRGLLRHQLANRLSPEEIATIHIRAGNWFAEHGLLDEALHHLATGGDTAGAATLVEAHTYSALGREDWNSVAHWLRAIPDSIIRDRPRLLLAKGWVSHFSGRSVPIRQSMTDLDELLERLEGDPAERAVLEAERDALSLVTSMNNGRDRVTALMTAQRAVEGVDKEHRLASGIAIFGLGCALQASGRTNEAVRQLTEVVAHEEERIDAGSIRAIGGLMFVHRQAGNYVACQEAAESALGLAVRHGLPVAAGWAHWMLGWLAYERDELEIAIEHFAAIDADHERNHMHAVCEAMFGLALAYQAKGMAIESAAVLRRLLELILDASALEYLPLFRGFEARLALLQGERQRAVGWLAMEGAVSIESNGLDAFDHPFLTRIKVLLAEGSSERRSQALRDLDHLQEFADACNHRGHQLEILGLMTLALEAAGQAQAAETTLRRAIAIAEPSGFLRTLCELSWGLIPVLRRLVARETATPFVERLLRGMTAADETGHHEQQLAASPDEAQSLYALLTPREIEVLECLFQRLSYQEIGATLYISLPTVKSHASNIYSKLGARNRGDAMARALSLGWSPLQHPAASSRPS